MVGIGWREHFLLCCLSKHFLLCCLSTPAEDGYNGGRPYVLRVTSAQDFEEWVDTINKVRLEGVVVWNMVGEAGVESLSGAGEGQGHTHTPG